MQNDLVVIKIIIRHLGVELAMQVRVFTSIAMFYKTDNIM